MYKKRYWIVVLTIIITLSGVGQAADIEAELSGLINPVLDQGQLGIYIKSLNEDKILYQYNSESPLVPASNEKLVTTIGAYYLIGPDYRYETELYKDKKPVKVDDYYFGNLALRGHGDPMFKYTNLIQMFRESFLKDKTEFRGNLYIDDTFFDEIRYGTDWSYDSAKEIGAIIFRDSSLSSIGDEPDTVPINVGRTVNMIFQGLGIKQQGRTITDRAIPDNMELFATYQSAPLIDIMKFCNKASDNSIAEQIFKTISAIRLGQGSFQGSELVLKEFYAGILGLNPGKYNLNDGSGLSHGNRIPPVYLGKMLEYTAYHPYRDKDISVEESLELIVKQKHPYINTLAEAGGEGTLNSRMNGARVYAKTGTLNGVDALSGYVVTKSDKVVVFSILVNDFTITRWELRQWEDKLVSYIYNNY